MLRGNTEQSGLLFIRGSKASEARKRNGQFFIRESLALPSMVANLFQTEKLKANPLWQIPMYQPNIIFISCSMHKEWDNETETLTGL